MFAATNPGHGVVAVVPFGSSVSTDHLRLTQRRNESATVHRSKSHPPPNVGGSAESQVVPRGAVSEVAPVRDIKITVQLNYVG